MITFADILQFPIRGRQRRAREQREDITREEFVAALAQDDFEARAADLLWDKLVEAAMIKDFRPLPDDHFLRLYGLTEEDLDEDIILEILVALGISVPPPELAREAGPIETPRDLLRLVRLAQNKRLGPASA